MKTHAEAIIIAGPTGSGKSDVAIEVAERVGGEIISVDSMQVYRGMDIGTAKVSPDDRARITHHMIDVSDPATEFDVAQYIKLAHHEIGRIIDHGRVPIFCGGTGLYLKALFFGIGNAPPKDPALRRELESKNLKWLQLELKKLSPDTYEHIDIQNPRRVIRAIEVATLTGESPIALRDTWASEGSSWPDQIYVICQDPGDHIPVLNSRVDEMIERGLKEETEKLLHAGIKNNTSGCQSIGYRQMIHHLEHKTSLDETIEEIKLRTRQFAKRQRTWFRNQMPSTPLPFTDIETMADIISRNHPRRSPKEVS